MGIHYDYKSTKGNKLMEKQAKREKKLAEKKAKRLAIKNIYSTFKLCHHQIGLFMVYFKLN